MFVFLVLLLMSWEFSLAFQLKMLIRYPVLVMSVLKRFDCTLQVYKGLTKMLFATKIT